MLCLWKSRVVAEVKHACNVRYGSAYVKILAQRRKDRVNFRARASRRNKNGLATPSDQPLQHGSVSKRLGADHGQKIYLYNHLIRNQIIYSLDARLHNNRALRQLPFNGKKSKPAALRKDHWRQLAVVEFPSGAATIGRSAFGKLREMKRLHELSFDRALIRRKESPKAYEDMTNAEKDIHDQLAKKDGKAPYAKREKMKRRRKLLNNQKSNVIADMATIFSRLSLAEQPKLTTGELRRNERAQRLGTKTPPVADPTQGTNPTTLAVEKSSSEAKVSKSEIGLAGDGSGTEVVIYWADADDAYHAKKWPSNVLHDKLQLIWNNRTRKERPFNVKMKHYIAQKEGAEKKLLAEPEVNTSSGNGVEKPTLAIPTAPLKAQKPQGATKSSKEAAKLKSKVPRSVRTPEQKAENMARHQKLVDQRREAFASKKDQKRVRHEALLAQHKKRLRARAASGESSASSHAKGKAMKL